MNENTTLEFIVFKIDNMEKTHHIEILRIIKETSPSVCISENKNGSFVNMNELSTKSIEEIKTYLKLNETIEEEIRDHETIKNTIIETYIH